MNLIHALGFALCLASAYRLSVADNTNETCLSADGIPGYCKPMSQCQQTIGILRRMRQGIHITDAEITYIRNLRCPGQGTNYVCCEKDEISEGMEVLMKQDCGHLVEIKLTYGGTAVGLMSRPWMALLKFGGFDDNQYSCGGTLITERFVLTAAHCFDNQELLSVRLGEHKISTTEDCEVNHGQRKCAPPVEDIGVERIIVHADYSNSTHHNDIALVKLLRDVQFKDSITPICLPVNKTLQRESETKDEFYVTGWGKTENTFYSDDLMETTVIYRRLKDCQRSFAKTIVSTQLCAGGNGHGACYGDSGGPLGYATRYRDNQRYVQFGIASYGSKNCSDQRPAVYTNVGAFISWIAENIFTV